MESNITNTILTVLIQIFSIAGSILMVGSWLGKKFDKVQDKFDKFCDEMKEIQLDAQKHVTFEHCHEKREACPCVIAVKDIQKQLSGESNNDSRRRKKN